MYIQHLHLYTNNLQAQHHFYKTILELPTSALQTTTFEVRIGQSQLHFHHKKNATNYHFAINIPANKIKEAASWLADRVVIQPYQGEEIVDFDFWNAEAVYFYDKDQNIVELIARKNTQPVRDDAFGAAQWLGISEIGTPVEDVPALCHWLIKEGGLERYSGDLKRFAAIGDEEGLFIIINNKERKWIPNQDIAHTSPFEIQLQVQNRQTHWRFEQGQFIIMKH
ncbi:MAG: VOC family protein [Aureispira sp.]